MRYLTTFPTKALYNLGVVRVFECGCKGVQQSRFAAAIATREDVHLSKVFAGVFGEFDARVIERPHLNEFNELNALI